MKKDELRKNISFENYKNFRNIKQTFNDFNSHKEPYKNNLVANDESNYETQLQNFIKNNAEYYDFLKNLYLPNKSDKLNTLVGFDRYIQNETSTSKADLNPFSLFCDFQNIILYANFLTTFYESPNNDEFINHTTNLLSAESYQFWLEDSFTAFNTFINKVKKNEILLKDYKSYLTPNKLLWGFDEFMKKATKETLNNHLNSLKYIKLISKQDALDQKIDSSLKNIYTELDL